MILKCSPLPTFSLMLNDILLIFYFSKNILFEQNYSLSLILLHLLIILCCGKHKLFHYLNCSIIIEVEVGHIITFKVMYEGWLPLDMHLC